MSQRVSYKSFKAIASHLAKNVREILRLHDSYHPDAESLKNFYDTFGYIKIPKFFSKEEISLISKIFDKRMKSKFGKIPFGHSRIYPQMLEEDEILTSILESEKMIDLMTALLGEDFIYYGSDGNYFSSTANWHRDWFNKTRSCKVGIYLEKLGPYTGALRVIPGSHFLNDAFSSFLSEALYWPEGPYAGGLDEKNFFGTGNSPHVLRKNHDIPHVVISSNPGDIIIFNQNIVHCTSRTVFPKIRRLLGIHFWANPKHTSNPVESKKEIEDLSLLELKQFALKERYGTCVLNSSSEKIQKMIAPLKYLSSPENGSNFLGVHDSISKEATDFCNRFKSNKFETKRFEN